MFPDTLKAEIQQAYRHILAAKSLRPRYGQRLMIAEIVRALAPIAEIDQAAAQSEEESDNTAPGPVVVVEAGTGTGKTLAYVLATLPVARHLGKKVVLATATVALQEQVIHRDLPDILKHSGLSFSYALAKGRGRYLCLSRLDLALQGNASQEAMLALFGETVEAPQGGADLTPLYEKMLERISRDEWQGDRDDWDGVLTNEEWTPVTAEAGQCAGPKCSNYSRCFFYQARDELDEVDVIVANHDLVLVDLALGGGAILPDPADTIYIFDEAHHLPIKANQHFSATTRLRSSLQWLETVSRGLARLAADSGLEDAAAVRRQHQELKVAIKSTVTQLSEALLQAQTLYAEQGEAAGSRSRPGADGGDAEQVSFELGVVPADLRESAKQLARGYEQISRGLKEICTLLRRQMESAGSVAGRRRAEQWFPVFGGMATRAEGSERLWQAFAAQDPPDSAPSARWMTPVHAGGRRDEEVTDLSLSSSPVLAARTLTEHLWQRCAGAVLTSATLSALGNFDVLSMRAGLPSHTVFQRIASPFDYQGAASLTVPRQNCDPGDTRAHTAAIVQLLPQLLDPAEASLMLFSSRRQMRDVLEALEPEWRDRVLCQDDYQKAQLLKLHHERIDQGQSSVIFGLASFSEGVDLPGKYCRHVLIAKIPFAVPNDPIEMTLAQWLERQGRNPFMTLAVPDAAFRLVQATGRLLRNESDTGRITVFDERLVNRFYGKSILDSLPPFRREIFPRLAETPA